MAKVMKTILQGPLKC